MADCSYYRCIQERRSIKRELQKWYKDMVYIVGESENPLMILATPEVLQRLHHHYNNHPADKEEKEEEKTRNFLISPKAAAACCFKLLRGVSFSLSALASRSNVYKVYFPLRHPPPVVVAKPVARKKKLFLY